MHINLFWDLITNCVVYYLSGTLICYTILTLLKYSLIEMDHNNLGLIEIDELILEYLLYRFTLYIYIYISHTHKHTHTNSLSSY